MSRCLVGRRLEIRNDARVSSCLDDWADGDAVHQAPHETSLKATLSVLSWPYDMQRENLTRQSDKEILNLKEWITELLKL